VEKSVLLRITPNKKDSPVYITEYDHTLLNLWRLKKKVACNIFHQN